MIGRLVSKFRRDRAGTAAAEMALMLPLLIALMAGGFEAGHYMWSEHKALKGVRDGARYAARLPFANYSCASDTLVGADAGTRTTAIQNLTRTGVVSGGFPSIPGWADDDVTVNVSCNAGVTTGLYAGITGGAPRVTVETTVGYPSVLSNLGFNVDGVQLRARATAAVTGL
jgi:Flp pilus assembly protein TadG